MKYFETSAKTTQGVEEAFLSLIHSVYLCNNRNGKQKIANVIIRKIILNENKEQKRNFKSISNHNKELTTKGLKNLISEIENEKDYEKLNSKIKEIEIYIEEMQPIKCDINYKSLFTLLFKKIGMIKDISIKYRTYANVYLQLMIVFPELKMFLDSFNKMYFILNCIHSIDDVDIKEKYYRLYTKNYKNLSNLRSCDLISIYNFLFHQKLKTEVTFILNLKVFRNLVIELSKRVQEVDKIKFGRVNESPYIFQIIESFLDVLIFFIILLNAFRVGRNKDKEKKRIISFICLILN